MTEEKNEMLFQHTQILNEYMGIPVKLREFIMKIPMFGMYAPSVHENVHKDSMTVIHMQW